MLKKTVASRHVTRAPWLRHSPIETHPNESQISELLWCFSAASKFLKIRRTNKNRINRMSWGSFQDKISFGLNSFRSPGNIFGVCWRILSTTKESNLRSLNQEQVFQVSFPFNFLPSPKISHTWPMQTNSVCCLVSKERTPTKTGVRARKNNRLSSPLPMNVPIWNRHLKLHTILYMVCLCMFIIWFRLTEYISIKESFRLANRYGYAT